MATTNEKPKNDWDKKELGVLWSKKAKNTGDEYLSGVINLKNVPGFSDVDVPVIIFSNKSKKEERHPDLRIYLSEKRAPRAADAKPKAATTTRTPAAKAAPVETAPVEDNELI